MTVSMVTGRAKLLSSLLEASQGSFVSASTLSTSPFFTLSVLQIRFLIMHFPVQYISRRSISLCPTMRWLCTVFVTMWKHEEFPCDRAFLSFVLTHISTGEEPTETKSFSVGEHGVIPV